MSLRYLFLSSILAMSLPNTAYAASAYTKWVFRHQVDAMTDEVLEMAVLSYRSDRIAFACWPKNPEYGVAVTFSPEIYISSLKKREYAYFVWVEAQVRFDDSPAARSLFKPEGENLRLLDYLTDPAEEFGGLEDTAHLMSFIDQIETAKVLRIRIQQRDGTPVNWWFDLADSHAALTRLRTLCPTSWSVK